MKRGSSWFKRKAVRPPELSTLSSPAVSFPPAKETERAWSEGDPPDLFGSRSSENTGVASPDVGTAAAVSPDVDVDLDLDLDPDTPSSLDIPDADAAAGGGGCEPSIERLRLLLCEANRAHSEDSFGDSENDDDKQQQKRGQLEREKRERQQQRRQQQSSDAIGVRPEQASFRLRDGGGRSSRSLFFADDDYMPALPPGAAQSPRSLGSSVGETEFSCFGEEQDNAADSVGAVAVAAAVEAVLMCPPQVLARTQDKSSSLMSSLLHSRGPQGSGTDERGNKADAQEADEAAVAAAVAAALAWTPPKPRLSMVAEEGGGDATDGGIVSTDGIGEVATASWEKRAGFATNQPSGRVCAGARGGRGGGGCAHCRGGRGVDDISVKAVVAGEANTPGEREYGNMAWRQARDAQSSSPPSPGRLVSGLARGGSSRAEKGANAVTATGEARPGGGGGTLVVGDGSGLEGGGGGVGAGAPRCCDSDSESLEGRGDAFAGVANVVLSQSHAAPVSPAPRVGKLVVGGGGDGGCDCCCCPPSVCSRQPEDIAAEEALAEAEAEGVFGRAPVGTDTATIGPAARIAALPTLELARLSQIDRLSDHDGYGGGPSTGVSSQSCTFFDCSAVATPDRSPLVRVGAEAFSGGEDGGETTPYRFRRLAGVGRGWPAGVNPARREEWLAPAEFEAVFGVPFATFRKFPSWKKILLKQEVGLF